MIFDFLKEIFKPAADLVDELHFSGEEKGNLEALGDKKAMKKSVALCPGDLRYPYPPIMQI